MPTCAGTTKTGTECRRNVAVEGGYCHQHVEQSTLHPHRSINPDVIERPPPPRCSVVAPFGSQCHRHALENDTMCSRHRKMEDIKLRKEHFQQNRERYIQDSVEQIQQGVPWKDVIDPLWRMWWQDKLIPSRHDYLELRRSVLLQAHVPVEQYKTFAVDLPHLVEDWFAKDDRINAVVVIQYYGPDAGLELIDDLIEVANGRINRATIQYRIDQGYYEEQTPPQQELGRLAHDKQNVHTRYVSEQTNETMNYLLKQGPQTWKAYHQSTYQDVRNTINDLIKRDDVKRDVKRWYNTATCREENDYLYRKCLIGLIEVIFKHPHREELLKRCGEEMVESVGMCCEGHISRLCNVLVGFDENVKQELSLGEQLQNKMAEIARKETSTEEKQEEARVVLRELGLPETEHQVWIEAF